MALRPSITLSLTMPSPRCLRTNTPFRNAGLLVLTSFSWLGLLGCADAQEVDPRPAPETFLRALSDEDYAPLTSNSPFLRTIAPANSLVLTGFARIEGELVVTVVDTVLHETFVVTPTENPKGWTLVEVEGEGSSVDKVRARIQIAQGEIVSIRYGNAQVMERIRKGMRQVIAKSGTGRGKPLSREQLGEAKRAAINYKEGYSADGYPNEPPRDMQRKLEQISVQQRESINREMFHLRNQGLGPEARLKIYKEKVDGALGARR